VIAVRLKGEKTKRGERIAEAQSAVTAQVIVTFRSSSASHLSATVVILPMMLMK
jgi:hypothetical protein